MRTYRYVLSGIRVALPFPLPVLRQNSAMEACADLVVRNEALPAPPASATGVGLGLWVDDGAIWFDLPKLGRMRIDQTGLATDLKQDVNLVMFEQILVGHIIGAVLHQSGVLPLHASCVVRRGIAVALAASRGVGKSTLAAALHARGWMLLADDLVAVRDEESRPRVWPGPARQRLSLEALTALGVGADSAIKLPHGEKWLMASDASTWATAPVPLKAVIELVPGLPQTSQLKLAEAAAVLHRHTFRRRLLAPLGREQNNALQCAVLAAQVPVFRVSRPDDLERLDALVDTIETLVDTLGV